MKYLTRIFLYLIIITSSTACNGQNKSFGILNGKLYDSKTNEGLLQATLILSRDSVDIKKSKTDLEGNFELDSIPVGTYNLKVLYIGFKPIEIRDIVIKSKDTSTIILGFNQETLDLKEVKVEWSGGYVCFIDSTGNFRCVKSK